MRIKPKSYTYSTNNGVKQKSIRKVLQKKFRRDMKRVLYEAVYNYTYKEVNSALLSYYWH